MKSQAYPVDMIKWVEKKNKERITVVGRKEKRVRGRRLVEDCCGEDWLANNSRERERGK